MAADTLPQGPPVAGKSPEAPAFLRRCTYRACTDYYPAGGYSAHAASSPNHRPTRQCSYCNKLYSAGRYAAHAAEHRRVHKVVFTGSPEYVLRAADLIHRISKGASLKEAGEPYGLSRERVRQIIKHAGVTSTRRIRPAHSYYRTAICPVCPEETARYRTSKGGWRTHVASVPGHVRAGYPRYARLAQQTMEMYAAGHTTVDIATAVGHGISTVTKWLHDNGVEMRFPGPVKGAGRYRRWTEAEIEYAASEHRRNVSFSRIGLALARSVTDVQRVLRREGKIA